MAADHGWLFANAEETILSTLEFTNKWLHRSAP
jgi:hypothetical protein